MSGSYTFGSSTDSPDIDSLEGLIQSIIDWSFLSHGDLGELGADDHSQYLNNTRGDSRYLYKENTVAFTPDGDYEPATKKYIDDIVSSGNAGKWLPSGNDIYYSTGNVGIGSAPGSYGLDVDSTGRFVQKLYLDAEIGTSNYASQSKGWQGDYSGHFDIRSLYTDELIAKTFIADIDLALLSGQMVTKSVTQVSRDFTVPLEEAVTSIDTTNDIFGISGDYTGVISNGDIFSKTKTASADYTVSSVSYNGTSGETEIITVENITDGTVDGYLQFHGSLYVECLPGHQTAWTFEVGDWIRLQIIDRSGGGLIWMLVWATIDSQDYINGAGDTNLGEQVYTVTIKDDGSSSGSVVHAGAGAQDLGQSGDGYILQEAGYGTYRPWLQIATWATDPSDPANTTIHTRLGNLKGLEGYDIVPTDPGYGLYCDNAYLTGKIIITSGETKGDIDDAKSDAYDALDLIMFDNTGKLIDARSPSGTGLFLGKNYLGYYDNGAWRTYMDNQGQFYLGGTSGALQWDGTSLKIEGDITLTNQITSGDIKGVDDYITGQDLQTLGTLNYDNPSTTIVDSGTADGTTADKLVDSSQDFNTTVIATDVVSNTTDATDAVVTAVDSDTQLSLSSDIMVSGENYEIKRGGLFMNATHLGYYNAQGWMTYMENTGDFYLGGTSGALRWHNGVLYIEGEIVITSGATKDAINSKTTTFRQDTVPTANAARDHWYDTGNDNRLYIATNAGDNQRGGGEWIETKDGAITTAQGTADANNALIPNDVDGLINFHKTSTPTADGLYLRDDHLGFYKYNTAIPDWTAYMDNQGQFYLGAVGESNYLAWSSGVLTIKGTINASSGTIGNWTSTAQSLYSGTEHTGNGYNTGTGITLVGDGSIHAEKFYINADGSTGFKELDEISTGSSYGIHMDTLDIWIDKWAVNTVGIDINRIGYQGGTLYYRHLDIYNGKGDLTLSTGGDATSSNYTTIYGELLISGGVSYKVHHDTVGGHTLGKDDYLALHDSGGNVIFYMPSGPNDGEMHVVKKIGAGNTTVNGNGNHLFFDIDIGFTYTLDKNGEVIILIYSASQGDWLCISRSFN